MSEALVVIGNGMAAARLVEELSKKALGRYAIAVIGEEPTLAYNRVMLSSVLAGDIDKGDLDLKPAKWWRDYGVTLRCGCKASAIDLESGLTLKRSEAAAVIAYRTKNGPFKSIEDLKKVPGIDAAKIEAKKDRLSFADQP